MAAHFTAQRRLPALRFNLLHFGFDERVAGFVHQGLASRGTNGRRQPLRTFHIKQDGAVRHSAQHIFSKQLHLTIGVNGFTVFGHNAQTIAITIKGQTQFGVGAFQGGHQVF